MRLSIVIPAHNEELRIGGMLEEYLPFFADRYGNDVELLVVVNGCTDDTEGVVKSYESRFPQLLHIVEPKRVGKGGALVLGFAEAKGDQIGFSDADGSTPPQAFQDLVDNLGEADAIIASRWCRGAEVSPRQPLLRRIASRTFNLLTRVLFGLRLTDTQCGAKLFRRNAITEVLPRLGITRWAFDVDLLFQLRRAGRRITEIPTVWHDVAGSKLEVASVSAEMAAALTRLRLIYSPFRWVVTFYDRYLGVFLHPPGVEQDHLLRHSLLLLSGSQVANLFNLAFQLVVVRMLSPADYGIMAAMLSVFMIISTPVNALDRTMAHFCAGFLQDGEWGKVRSLLLRLVRDVSIVVLPLFLMCLAGSSRIAGFFHIHSPWPVALTAGAVLIACYRPIVAGTLTGAQAFVWYSTAVIGWSVARLVFAVILVGIGFGAAGALASNTLAMALSLVVAIVGIRHVMRPVPSTKLAMRSVYPYFLAYLAALAGYSVLASADVVLVKHYFDEVTAGQFAKVVMVARIVIFLPMPIAIAMFPKVVSFGQASHKSWRTLLKALVLVGSIALVAVVLCTVFPRLILGVLVGDRSPALIPLVRGMVWALAPLAIVFVVMNFELAQRRFMVTVPLLLCAAAYLFGVILWHDSLMQVVVVLGVCSGVSSVLATACMPWRSMSEKVSTLDQSG